MPHDPLIGRQLANYQIERVLGRGGMAQVYYGQDTILKRPAAIKVIDARFRDNPSYARRFVQEAQTIARWRHENILQVYYAGEADGLYFFAMEYIDGLDLNSLLAKYTAEGSLIPHADVLRIGRAVAVALDYAHQSNVIHRDVKPANVLVAHDRRVVLADFGLALDVQQGSAGETFGSAHYIAPEQARRSSNAVPQSDLYSLGVILYEMLTGLVPFDDPSPTSLAVQHLTLPPPPPRQLNPNLSEAVETVLLKALSKQPEQRFQSGRQLMDALAEALAASTHSSLLTPPPTTLQLSPVSAAQQVAQHLATRPPLPPLEPIPIALAAEPFPPPPARLLAKPLLGPNRLRWAAAAGCLFAFIATTVVILALWAIAQAGNNLNTTAATETAVANIISTAAGTPTILPIAGLTTTAAPAGSTSEQVGDQPIATILSPSGRPIQLLYDPYSFYFYNPGTDSIAIRSIAFESLDTAGQPIGYRFDGLFWSQFHFEVQPGRCDRIETIRAESLLRPNQCGGYNATVTPQITAETVFWIPREGVEQFRVLWDNQEIGRCQVSQAEDASSCELFLP